jgi:hypothetical protein
MAKKRVKATSSTSSNLHIPKDEQWRLINESGILKTASETPVSKQPAHWQASETVSLAEEVADAFLYITPFSFLLLMMEMYIYLSISLISLTSYL